MTATLASYDSRNADRLVFLGGMGVPLGCMERRVAAPDVRAIAHIVAIEGQAAAPLVALCRGAGLETRIHAGIAAFAEAGVVDAPSCLLVHVGRHAASAIEALARRVASGASFPPMVIVAERADVRSAVRAMKAGAVEFFDTPPREQDLLDAITAAIGMARAQRRLAADCAALEAAFDRLTAREREVMALVTRGLLNKQVAGELGIQEITVKAHRGAVMRKMGARTLADLVRMADTLAYLTGGAGSGAVRSVR
jgi:FixJ family two-component response regulator